MNRQQSPRPVLVNAMPKAGTKLLSKVLKLLGFEWIGPTLHRGGVVRLARMYPLDYCRSLFERDLVEIGLDLPLAFPFGPVRRHLTGLAAQQFVTMHLGASEEIQDIAMQCKMPVIIVVRDPRAVLLSGLRYYESRVGHPLYRLFAQSDATTEQRLLWMIRGVSASARYSLAPLSERYRSLLGWCRDDSTTITTRFEYLVGSKGGGNDRLQNNEIDRIGRFLSVDVSKPEKIARDLFAGTETFRKGRVDSWRDELSVSQQRLIEAELSNAELTKWMVDL